MATQRRGASNATEPRTRGAPVDANDWATRAFVGAAGWLARYHRHRVLHLERLGALFDAGRRVVVVGNHALDIVDPLLFCAEVYGRFGRAPHFIGHENGWFRIPVLREISERFHVIPSRRPEETVAALREGGFLMLYPGANREAALRSYRDDPYHLDWSGRKGFLRVALEADADLLFVAAVGIDEAYYQSRLPTPQALVRYATGGDGERYRGARLAFGLLGPHLVPGVCPLPVRITHVVSEPISLGSATERAAAKSDARTLGRLHRKVWRRCQALLDEAVGGREPESDWLDRTVRRTQSLLQRIGV